MDSSNDYGQVTAKRSTPTQEPQQPAKTAHVKMERSQYQERAAAILESFTEYSVLNPNAQNLLKAHVTRITHQLRIEIEDEEHVEWASARLLLDSNEDGAILDHICHAVISAALESINNQDRSTDEPSTIAAESDTADAAKAAAQYRIRQLVAANSDHEAAIHTTPPLDHTQSELIPLCNPSAAPHHNDHTTFCAMSSTQLALEHDNNLDRDQLQQQSSPRLKASAIEERDARYVYKGPFAANGDRRHPSVIDHEARTGINNVVGTGLDGRLRSYDIIMAATIVDNMPEHLKTTFMTDEEKADYEAQKAIRNGHRTIELPQDGNKIDHIPSECPTTGRSNSCITRKEYEPHNINISDAGQQPQPNTINAQLHPAASTLSPSEGMERMSSEQQLHHTAVRQRSNRGRNRHPDDDSVPASSNSGLASPVASPSIPNTESSTELIHKPATIAAAVYSVEHIVGHKSQDGTVYYHVKWEDHGKETYTWEPASNLSNEGNIVDKYRASRQELAKVECIRSHRKWPGTMQGRTIYNFEYMVKWAGLEDDFNTWEQEDKIVRNNGTRALIYYRIRNNVAFGRGRWNAKKQKAAIKLLQDAKLRPEPDGRITVAEVKQSIQLEHESSD